MVHPVQVEKGLHKVRRKQQNQNYFNDDSIQTESVMSMQNCENDSIELSIRGLKFELFSN